MTPIEILALVFSIAVIAKLLIIFVNKDSWKKFVSKIYSRPGTLIAIELIFAAIVLYYLLQELTIVQIAACILLSALLTGMTFATYSKEIIPSMLKTLKKGTLKKAWLPIVVWLALAIWTLFVIL